MTENTKPQFAIQGLYIKDLSFESPNAPQIFGQKAKPQANMDLQTRNRPLGDNRYEVVLSITVTMTAEENTVFLVELQQAGIFVISGLDDEQLKQTLGSYCPNVLFPYARQTVATIVMQGGFEPIHLSPVNFDALYLQHLKQEQQKPQSAETH